MYLTLKKTFDTKLIILPVIVLLAILQYPTLGYGETYEEFMKYYDNLVVDPGCQKRIEGVRIDQYHYSYNIIKRCGPANAWESKSWTYTNTSGPYTSNINDGTNFVYKCDGSGAMQYVGWNATIWYPSGYTISCVTYCSHEVSCSAPSFDSTAYASPTCTFSTEKMDCTQYDTVLASIAVCTDPCCIDPCAPVCCNDQCGL
jgi:hypothetical protein